MAKLLKKIETGNPLVNLGLTNLYNEYKNLQTDQEISDFYHRLLSATEGIEIATAMAYAMIDYSVGRSFNPLILFKS